MMNNSKIYYVKTAKIALLGVGFQLLLLGSANAKFDGFYVGGSVGYLQQNTSINASQNPANPNADVHKSTTGRGIPVTELFLGWGHLVANRFYFGVEGQVDFVLSGSKNVAEDTNFIYQSGRKGPGFALLGRVGYMVLPQALLYLGIGAKIAEFKHNIHEKADNTSACFYKRSMHLHTECGLEIFASANKNISYRIAYAYTPRKEVVKSTSSFPTRHLYNDRGIYKSGISEHAMKVGVVYRF